MKISGTEDLYCIFIGIIHAKQGLKESIIESRQ